MIEKFDPSQVPYFDMTKLNLADIRRASQAKVDQPPSVNQKASMRKHFVEADMILHMAKLIVKEHISGFIFGDKCYGALMAHARQSAKLNLIEYNTLAELLNKAGLNYDISSVAPTFFGKSFRIDYQLEHGVISQFKSGEQILINPTSFKDAKDMIQSAHLNIIIMLALFYFLDLKELLDENRGRGQALNRFLRVYASPQLNDLLFEKLEYFTRAMRLMTLNGIALNDITMEMLARNVDATVKANQE